jgi:hypothetical protein
MGRIYEAHSHIYDTTTGAWKPDTGAVSGGGGASTNESLRKEYIGDVQTVTTVSGNEVLVSDELDVTNYKQLLLFINHAALSTSSPEVGTEYRVEVTSETSANSAWATVQAFRTIGDAAATFVCGAENPAQTVIGVNPTPAYTSTDIIFFKNNDDFTNSEWAKVANVVNNTSVDIIDGLTNTQESSNIFNLAEMFVVDLDVAPVTRVRVVCHNNMHGNSYLVGWNARAVASWYL